MNDLKNKIINKIIVLISPLSNDYPVEIYQITNDLYNNNHNSLINFVNEHYKDLSFSAEIKDFVKSLVLNQVINESYLDKIKTNIPFEIKDFVANSVKYFDNRPLNVKNDNLFKIKEFVKDHDFSVAINLEKEEPKDNSYELQHFIANSPLFIDTRAINVKEDVLNNILIYVNSNLLKPTSKETDDLLYEILNFTNTEVLFIDAKPINVKEDILNKIINSTHSKQPESKEFNIPTQEYNFNSLNEDNKDNNYQEIDYQASDDFTPNNSNQEYNFSSLNDYNEDNNYQEIDYNQDNYNTSYEEINYDNQDDNELDYSIIDGSKQNKYDTNSYNPYVKTEINIDSLRNRILETQLNYINDASSFIQRLENDKVEDLYDTLMDLNDIRFIQHSLSKLSYDTLEKLLQFVEDKFNRNKHNSIDLFIIEVIKKNLHVKMR